MQELTVGDTSWIHLDNPSEDEVYSLADRFPFHRFNLADCVSKRQPSKVERHSDYLFVIVQLPVWEEKNGYVASQVSVFIGRNYVVTINDGRIKSLIDTFRDFKESSIDAEKIAEIGSEYLFFSILHPMIVDIFPLMEDLGERLRVLKEYAYSPRREALFEISELRGDLSDLRRTIAPLRMVAPMLKEEIKKLTGEDLDIYFNDITDHVEKIWELYDESRETAEIYKDTDFILYQQVMNRALIILTVIFTITIPLSIISSLYGMNVNLPGGVETGPLTFLGPHTTFIVLLAISLTPTLIMLTYFRRLGWI